MRRTLLLVLLPTAGNLDPKKTVNTRCVRVAPRKATDVSQQGRHPRRKEEIDVESRRELDLSFTPHTLPAGLLLVCVVGPTVLPVLLPVGSPARTLSFIFGVPRWCIHGALFSFSFTPASRRKRLFVARKHTT